jgi:hypothetical protein
LARGAVLCYRGATRSLFASAAMNEPSAQRRSTAVSIDLLGLKDPWIAWCASQGVTPSQAFRAIVQRLTDARDPVIATPPSEATPLRTTPPGEASVRRISLRLTASEQGAVVQRAAAAAMTPSRWIRALVRSHLTREPQFGDRELEAVVQSNTQLRYLGRNLNQVAKGLNASAHERLLYKVDLIERLEAAIESHTNVVSRLLAANLERWRLVE